MAGTTQAGGRRAELIDIAAELFANRGYAQTTVRDIADAAGMLSGSLYHHFSSKEAILDEILRTFMHDMRQDVTTIVEGPGSPQERLDALVRHAFSVIHTRPHAVALFQDEASRMADMPHFAYVVDIGAKIEKLWLRTLEAGQQSGDFRADLNMNIVYRFIREAIWATVRWYNPRGRSKHDHLAEQYLTVLHGGLIA